MIWINSKKTNHQEENIWYDWQEGSINYIPEPKKTVSGFKDQFMGLLETWNYSKPKRVKTVYGSAEKRSKLGCRNNLKKNR